MLSSACDALVVGAGPTGLTAALVLARRGVRVRIVDRAPAPSDRSRAIVVQARTFELLDRVGLADELLAASVPARATNLHVEGQPVLRVDIAAARGDDCRFPLLSFASQVDTEGVLNRGLERLGRRVERGVSLRALVADADGVDVTLDGPGGPESVRAAWVIGADGAHSAVRRAIGLPFDGAAYPSDFLLGDVVPDDAAALDEIQLFLSRAGFAARFPLPGGRVRWMTTAATPGARDVPLPLDELMGRVSAAAGRPVTAREASWLARFHLHHRGVPRYREGRVFVAGDAAHIHSPAGGQGMNTGIQDAWNLAWKLAMVVRGEADPRLLDSYDAERQPVGARLLQFTDRAFSAAATDNAWIMAARSLVLPLLAPHVATPERQRRTLRFVAQLGIRYRRSPAVAEDFEGTPPTAGPRAGDRAPALPLPHGDTGAPDWLVLAFCGSGAASPGRFGARVAGALAGYDFARLCLVGPEGADVVDRDGAIAARWGVDGPSVFVVRPDGHVAFRSSGDRADPLARWLDGWARPRGLRLG